MLCTAACSQVDQTTEAKIVRTAKIWPQFSVYSASVADAIVRAGNASNAARAAAQAKAHGSAQHVQHGAVPQRSLLSIGQPAAQRPRLEQHGSSSLFGSLPATPHAPLHAHAGAHSNLDPNAPSCPQFDSLPITHQVHSALASIPLLASPQMQIDASACTRAIARVDPALSEQVAWEVRRVQNELGGLPAMAAATHVSDFAAYIVDVILYHQEKMQSQAAAAGRHAPVAAPVPVTGPSSAASAAHQSTQASNGWVSAADAAHRSDVLDGWCINVHDSSAVTALHEGLPFQSTQDGARFRTQQALREHGAWLASKVRSDVQGVVSQGWFKPCVEWLQCQPGTENSGQHEKYVSFFDRQTEGKDTSDDEAALAAEAPAAAVPVDPTQTECPLCGEAFRKHFDAALQKWVYLGVVQVDGVIYDAEAWADEQSARQRARKRPREQAPMQEEVTAVLPSAGPAATDSPPPPPKHTEVQRPASPIKPTAGASDDSDDDLFGGSLEHDSAAAEGGSSPAQGSDVSA